MKSRALSCAISAAISVALVILRVNETGDTVDICADLEVPILG
jgi:hypothetical protein